MNWIPVEMGENHLFYGTCLFLLAVMCWLLQKLIRLLEGHGVRGSSPTTPLGRGRYGGASREGNFIVPGRGT